MTALASVRIAWVTGALVWTAGHWPTDVLTVEEVAWKKKNMTEES